jgi:hypothetical protein
VTRGRPAGRNGCSQGNAQGRGRGIGNQGNRDQNHGPQNHCVAINDDPELKINEAQADFWENHLTALEQTLTHLQDNNFTINPLKCEWAVQETDWLGSWLTPNCMKPWKKKIESMLKLQSPQNMKESRLFIGAVNHCRDPFLKRSHVLKLLTELTKPPEAKFIWTPKPKKLLIKWKH